MGKCDKKTTYEILDFFFDAGGNFIDTANNCKSLPPSPPRSSPANERRRPRRGERGMDW